MILLDLNSSKLTDQMTSADVRFQLIFLRCIKYNLDGQNETFTITEVFDNFTDIGCGKDVDKMTRVVLIRHAKSTDIMCLWVEK